MDTVHVLQSSFAAGEISPSMIARTDVSKVAMAAMTLRNRTVLPHGPTECRPGFELIEEAGDSAHRVVIRPFVFGVEQEYQLEFGHYYLRFYKDGGVIVKTTADTADWAAGTTYAANAYVKASGLIYRCIAGHTSAAATEPGVGASWATVWAQSAIYQIATPWSEDEVYDLNLTQSADTVWICHPAFRQRVLTRTAHNSWALTPYAFSGGPFMSANAADTTLTASAVSGNATLAASSAIFESGHVGSLWKLTHVVAGQRQNGAITSATATAAVRGKGRWKVVTHGTWTGKLDLERSSDGSTWSIYRSYSSANDNNIIDAEDSDGIYSYRLNMWSFTSGTCSYDLTMASHDWDGIVEVTGFTSTTSVSVAVKGELAATSATKEWAEGAWSDVRGWPACSTFFQNRLWFGSTITQPNYIWGSKTDDYSDFEQSTPTVDDDPLVLPLVTRQVNAIRAMVALSEILAFTASSEWRIDAASGGVVTPSNVIARTQGYRGASTVDPVMIGNRVVFVQEQGSVVRDLGYKFDEDVYTGSDLTILATHLFRNHGIIDMCYQREPQSVIWCVRDDGVLLGMTYLKEQEVWAWHRHDTDGCFESVSSIAGATRNELWAIVRRTISGNTKRFIERLSESVPSQDPVDQTHLDCFLTYRGVATRTVGGLGHLEGKTVVALADGAVVRNLTVVGGAITLPTEAEVVHVGLPYVCDLELPDVEIALRDGTCQGRLKKVASVVLRLQDSRSGKIGTSFGGTLDDIPYDNPTTYGAAAPLFSGEKRTIVPGDWDTRGRVVVRQEDPLPLTVLAIIREVSLGG